MGKVKFGLKNVHYAVVTETADNSTGEITSSYGTVKEWPGAVSISLDPAGDDVTFYADDGVYYTAGVNNGYTGTFESAMIPEDVYTAVFGDTKDTNDVIVESNNSTRHYIALMFEFKEDNSGRRNVYYRCSLSRPTVASSTTGDTVDVQTDTVNLTVTPRPDDGKVKAFVEKSEDTTYTNWYQSVYVSA